MVAYYTHEKLGAVVHACDLSAWDLKTCWQISGLLLTSVAKSLSCKFNEKLSETESPVR